jgi:hypothetical protein
MSKQIVKCTNCGSVMSCGCQKRVASDGKHCCKNCITTYENNLKLIKNSQSNKD